MVFVLVIAVNLNRLYAQIYDRVYIPSPNDKVTYFLGQKNAKNGVVKYVSMGDSLTAGVGVDSIEKSYPYLVAKKISKEFPDVELIDLGVPGAGADDVFRVELPMAVKENPDYVTLLVGINDIHDHVSKDKFKKQYEQILDTLLSKTTAKIVILNVPYLGAPNLIVFPYSNFYDGETRQFNLIIKQLAEKKNLPLVDLFTSSKIFQSDPARYYSPDLFHPNEAGYRIWGDLINAR